MRTYNHWSNLHEIVAGLLFRARRLELIKARARRLAVLACLIASGCVSPTPPIAGQHRADVVVWHGLYGMAASPPGIRWRTADCEDGYRFKRTLSPGGAPTDECVGGVYWEVDNVAEVARAFEELVDGAPVPPRQLSETTYAHEYWHAVLYLTTGDAHASHDDPGFGLDWGHPRGIVDDANAALAEVGL